jgi:hypothetical protein
MKITEADATAAGICRRMRVWFRKHNLDWDRFCSEGIEYVDLMAVGDRQTLINRSLEKARARHERG